MEAAKIGDEQGFKDAQNHPLLIGILYGICLAVALSLPVAWYWRIAAFFAMVFFAGFIRMALWPNLSRDGRRFRREGKEAAAAARRIIRQTEAKAKAEFAPMLASMSEAADECGRRSAELDHIEAHGTPEERQWVAELKANPFMTSEEAQRRFEAPSPSARIERYRAECAAYNAARAKARR